MFFWSSNMSKKPFVSHQSEGQTIIYLRVATIKLEE